MYCACGFFVESFELELLFHIFLPTVGESKINQFQVVGVFVDEEYVFEFEVAMCDVLGVEVAERLDQLEENNLSLRL